MAAASARPAATGVPCALQYCRSMAMAAEPQPSSVCLTYGTSSHTPELFAGAAWANSVGKKANRKPVDTRSIEVFSNASAWSSAQNGYQRNDQNRDDDDDQQVAVRQASRTSSTGEIVLHLARARSQVRQIFIAQLADRFVHFPVIDIRGLERLLRLLGGKQLSQRGLVGSAHFGGPRCVLAQLLRGDDVFVLRLHARSGQCKARQKDYCQGPATPLPANVHPSSCNPFVG